MDLPAGSRWRSAVDTTEVIVVRPPTTAVDLECGGASMVPVTADAPGGAVDPDHNAGTELGKRYVDDDAGIEVLCTRPGDGSLAVAGRPLVLKEAKPLPSSD
ncbi:MAG TPA: hypothetical protein VHB02_12355 [Acidimicrobiales bacterium]|nr:hypothetical protein [Acidimicrobiales bacterium]